ncbi:DUF3164 family protein [Flavobacterium kingsejongi]|uniref:DUF3164 domain-containing protein n=1 Tax=Flavobacterium kingsejongi TaxID=1678728 RepID=A0A2S1LMS5_9FLAO|nr:DUF3164 family protein [Flavobacterium kingsejongi]AWG24807.1 hypothetical protein FK004_05980 [Flavobacterium kingsejongi]AWG25047.1 hypothetical protein FK004_07275 [Flavobacterium kingsejongi]
MNTQTENEAFETFLKSASRPESFKTNPNYPNDTLLEERLSQIHKSDVDNFNETQKAKVLQLSDDELKAELNRRESAKVSARESYKDLVQDTLPKALLNLTALSQLLSEAKRDIFKYFENILELKSQVFGIKEKQQTHTFSTEIGEITIGYRVTDGWDDTASAGIEKVSKFINSLSKNAETAALVDMVFNLLKKDAKGNLKGSRVLELQKLETKFNNAEFSDGVKIIAAAYKPVRSCWFIEAYTILDDGKKVNIPLAMSSADFPAGYEFQFNKS